MAKRKDITTPGNDYLEQLQWRSRHRRFWPVQYEPNWKYKIVRRHDIPLWLSWIASALLLIGLAIVVIDLYSSNNLKVGAKIFFGIVFGLILTILYFAVKDGSKNDDRDSEQSNGE